MDLSCGGHAPVLGALYHKPGAIARHGAVAWGYGRGADRRGVEIHQKTEVVGISVEKGRVTGVRTTRGDIATRKVLCAVAGSTPTITDMVGLRTPIYIHPLQAMVSEPIKPWLDPIIVSGSLHVYVSQSARGELVMGASLDPYELHSTRSTLDFAESLAAHMLDLFPSLSHVKINRQWAGMADMTPDFAPIMGRTPVEGFYLDAGWGTWGFKATPVCGVTMAHTVATDRNHALIEGFTLSRFADYRLTGEKGAASVGH
jgi:sarcosine oxidase, subunit beta